MTDLLRFHAAGVNKRGRVLRKNGLIANDRRKKPFSLQFQRLRSQSGVITETVSITLRTLIVSELTQIQAFYNTRITGRMAPNHACKKFADGFDLWSIGGIDNKCQENIEILSSEGKTSRKERRFTTLQHVACLCFSTSFRGNIAVGHTDDAGALSEIDPAGVASQATIDAARDTIVVETAHCEGCQSRRLTGRAAERSFPHP